MRNRLLRGLALALPLAIGLAAAATASAGVPWWAHWWRGTKLPVAHCSSTAASAVQSVTGTAPEKLTLDANTRLIRGFTTDAGIIVHCSAGTSTVCGKPAADLSITVFSNANNATSIRDQINTKFGNPQLIDCN